MITYWFWLNFTFIMIKYCVFMFLVIILLGWLISKFVLNRFIFANDPNELFKCSNDELVEKIYDLDHNEKKVLYDSRNKVSLLNVISFVGVISLFVNQYLIYEFGPLKQYYINEIASFVSRIIYYRPFFLTEDEIFYWNVYFDVVINNSWTYELLVAIIVAILVDSLCLSMNKYNKFVERLKLVILMSEDKSRNPKNKAKIKLNTTMLGK